MRNGRFEISNLKRVTAVLLLAVVAGHWSPAGATTVTGTIKRPDGTGVNGTIEFVLSQQAKTTTPPIVFAPVRTQCAVTNGAIAAGCTVQGNDTLDPAGTFYTVRVVDSNNLVVVPATNYTITGTAVDLGTLPVTATATLVPPSGNVVGNLNVTGNLTVGGTVEYGVDPLIVPGNLKVGGATQLGSSADLSCTDPPATPNPGDTRFFCKTSDKRLYWKDDAGTEFGPFAAPAVALTWTAPQTFINANNVRYANAFAGADAGAKIAACVADLPSAGGTCDARGLEGAQTIAASIAINKPVRLLLGPTTFTWTGGPLGQATGILNITADDVEIGGAGWKTVLTQGNAQNAQTVIHLQTSDRIYLHDFKLDGNEDNQTDLNIESGGAAFYTGIKSIQAAGVGSFDVRIERLEITRAGDNAIHLRDASRVWLLNSYIHHTGVNIAGTGAGFPGSNGNALSISAGVDAELFTDVWVVNNIFERWGDTVEVAHGKRIHFIGNILRGARNLGLSPRDDESGIGLTGAKEAEVTGNQVYDVDGEHVRATAQTTTSDSTPHDITVTGNLFRATAAGMAAANADATVNITHGATTFQLYGIQVTGNRLEGVRLRLGNVEGATVTGNIFKNTTNSGGGQIGVILTQSANGGVMKDFNISDNIFQNTDGTMLTGIFVDTNVITPGAATFSANTFDGVTTEINFATAATADKVSVRKKDSIDVQRATGDALAGTQLFKKSRGTNDSPAAITSGDRLGSVNAYGFDGTAFTQAAEMRMRSTGTIAAGMVPGVISFWTANSGGTLTEAWQINASQAWLPVATGQDIGGASQRPDVFAEDFRFYSGTAFAGIFDHANTADRTYTLPDATTTVAGLSVAQVFTAAGGVTLDNQLGLRLREATANGTDYVELRGPASVSAPTTYTWNITGDCTGNVNGGALTVDGSKNIVCSDDDGGGGGGGDNVSVNGAAATNADFDDATPAAPGDGVNVRWQKDALDPTNISANLAFASGSVAGAVSTAAQTLAGEKTFNNGLISGTMKSAAADPADAGVLRLGNAEQIGWEASPAGTDVTLSVDASEILQASSTFNATTLTEGGNAVPNSTDNLSFFSATTSAQLAGVISNETGSGALTFATTPTFTTSITAPVVISADTDPADAGAFRLGNAEVISWEASPAGTDETIGLTAGESFAFSGPLEVDATDPADAEAVRLDNNEGIAWEASPAGTDVTLKVDASEILQASGTFNAATLTEGGNSVPNSTDNLSFFAATTSAQLAGVISDETGSGVLVFGTSPTLAGTPNIGDGAGNDKLNFAEEASNPTCAAGDYFIWANSGDARLKKCQNATVTDLDTNTGGSPPWESLVNSTDAATTYTSDNTAEAVTFSFHSAFTTGSQYLIRQQTGNPTGGDLLRVSAADADVNVLRLFQTNNGGANSLFYSGDDLANFASTVQFVGDAPNVLAYRSPTSDRFVGTGILMERADTANDIGALYSAASARHTTGTLSAATAVQGDVYATGSGGTTTTAQGLAAYVEATAGNITDAIGVRVFTPSEGTGAISNAYGMVIDTQAGVAPDANTFSIKSGGGLARFATGAAGIVGMQIDAAASQTADLQQWRSSTPTVLASVKAGGAIDTTVGYRVNNGATTGRCLRGDGTNFVQSASNCVLTDSTDTLQFKTLNVEDSGNVITTVSKVTMIAAGCDNATAASAFDLPTSGTPTKVCLGTSPHRLGALGFADGATNTGLTAIELPSDWTGNVDLRLLYGGDTSSANNIRWQVSTACVADGEDQLNPTYNTASASNTAGPSTAGQRKSVSFTSVNVSSCAASETMWIKVERIGADAGDTYAGVAYLRSVELTLRRAQ